MTTKEAQFFLENYTGSASKNFFLLEQSGSSRRNYVAEMHDRNLVVTYNDNLAENESFFYFSDLFATLNLKTPRILKISEDRKLYVQEFVGGKTLSEMIQDEGLSDRVTTLVKTTLMQLAELQNKSEFLIDYSNTFEYEEYDEFPISNDLYYFKSFIADVLEIPYHKAALLKEFKALIHKIENLQPRGIMIRDFQARNIMVNEKDEVFFIDYQSAMRGPLMYDVISLLYQAKANFTAEFRDEMLTYYFSFWDEQKQVQLKASLVPLQLVRYLQVLGAYGFRGLIQRKQHFLASIDKGIDNLYQLAITWETMKDYPELKNLILQLKNSETQSKIEALVSK